MLIRNVAGATKNEIQVTETMKIVAPLSSSARPLPAEVQSCREHRRRSITASAFLMRRDKGPAVGRENAEGGNREMGLFVESRRLLYRSGPPVT